MTWRLLNLQGIVGVAAGAILLALLLLQKGETRHWRKQSAQYERLYRAEHTAFATTVANYRAAAEAARAADRAASARAAAEQRRISERIVDDYETRLASARAAAERLRGQVRTSQADSGAGRAAAVPAAGEGAGAAAGLAAPDRLSLSAEELEWRLLATEQAIQLDELIKWVRAQSAVEPDGKQPRR